MKVKKVIVEVYSRVVGYMRPVNQWNKGKQEEFKDRKTYHEKEIKNELDR
jgi:anaerobic ribonucleoside-triphosphate reductase